MAELSKEKQEWVDNLFNQWGAWEFSGIDLESKPNQLYILMKSIEGRKLQEREMCDDDLGILMNQMINYYIRTPSPEDYEFLVARFVYQHSIYAIAKWKHRNDKRVTERQWRRRIEESIKASQWIVAKMLDVAVKNHKNAMKLQKFVFRS